MPTVWSKVASARQRDMGVIALSDSESEDESLDVTIDAFIGSLRYSLLEYCIVRRRENLAKVFDDTFAKVKHNNELYSSSVAIEIREEMKTDFAKLKASVEEIRLLIVSRPNRLLRIAGLNMLTILFSGSPQILQ